MKNALFCFFASLMLTGHAYGDGCDGFPNLGPKGPECRGGRFFTINITPAYRGDPNSNTMERGTLEVGVQTFSAFCNTWKGNGGIVSQVFGKPNFSLASYEPVVDGPFQESEPSDAAFIDKNDKLITIANSYKFQVEKTVVPITNGGKFYKQILFVQPGDIKVTNLIMLKGKWYQSTSAMSQSRVLDDGHLFVYENKTRKVERLDICSRIVDGNGNPVEIPMY